MQEIWDKINRIRQGLPPDTNTITLSRGDAQPAAGVSFVRSPPTPGHPNPQKPGQTPPYIPPIAGKPAGKGTIIPPGRKKIPGLYY